MLEKYVYQYQNDPFKPTMSFYDANDEEISKEFTFSSANGYLDDYLSFYRNCQSLDEAIKYSCLALFKFNYGGEIYEIRHPHQHFYQTKNNEDRGVPTFVLNNMRSKLSNRIDYISKIQNFEQLFNFVTSEKVHRFGPLAIYDTSVRIGAFLDKEPTHVYLHAGTKQGIANLESKQLVKSGLSSENKIPVSALPEELQSLHPIQIENFLCLYKEKFKLLDSDEIYL